MSKKIRKYKGILASLVILSLFSTLFVQMPLTTQATSISQLEKENSDLREKLEGINESILDINDELDEIEMQTVLTESEMARTREQLAASKEKEEEQYDSMKLRIRYMYEHGQTSMLEILFGAESLVDLINRSEFINAITEYDRNMLNGLIEITEEIKFEEENLIAQRKALDELEATAKLKQQELKVQAEATSTDLVKVQKEIADAKEAARLEAERQEAANNQAGSSSSGSSGSSSGSSGGTSTGGTYEGSSSELDVFAALLDCESYGQYDYMLAVATVIMNRVEDRRFPNTVNGVVYQKGQFSPTWTGKLDRVLQKGASSLAYRVAKDAMNGARLSKVSHCYFFLTASATSRPGINVGGNLFFVSW